MNNIWLVVSDNMYIQYNKQTMIARKACFSWYLITAIQAKSDIMVQMATKPQPIDQMSSSLDQFPSSVCRILHMGPLPPKKGQQKGVLKPKKSKKGAKLALIEQKKGTRIFLSFNFCWCFFICRFIVCLSGLSIVNSVWNYKNWPKSQKTGKIGQNHKKQAISQKMGKKMVIFPKRPSKQACPFINVRLGYTACFSLCFHIYLWLTIIRVFRWSSLPDWLTD